MKISKTHSLGTAEVRQRVDNLATALSGKYGLRTAWDGDDLKISGSGVDGHIAVADKSIDVDIKLGLALSMMESTIRTSIEDAIDEHLA